MTKHNTPVTDQDIRLGRRVNRQVSGLLSEIEKEDVPDRLLDLARELQKALNEKTGSTDG